MKWIEEHEKECKILDSDKCMECFHISESLYALSEAREEMEAKKNQPKPKTETNLVYNYRLREWREVTK
jgi:hypothetical protein